MNSANCVIRAKNNSNLALELKAFAVTTVIESLIFYGKINTRIAYFIKLTSTWRICDSYMAILICYVFRLLYVSLAERF